MICYDECELNKIRESPEFKSGCEEYHKINKQVEDLKVFIDSIQLNSKYFRLSINTGGKKYKSY